jgi:branched-chain amino acid transport system ATP-binding protein
LAGEPLLAVEGLETGYGKKQVLFGVSLAVQPGEVVAIIGPNGSGKSTALRAICGLLSCWRGSILFDRQAVNGNSPAKNLTRGLAFAPQGNRVFDELSVMENLEIGGFTVPRKLLPARFEEVFRLFPVLKERRRQVAGRLSGGERQMLALARALIPKPKLLMLDEPSLGLFAGMLKDVFGMITRVNHETGTAFLVVEQKVREVLAISNRVYSLKLGRVAFAGSSSELRDNKERLKELFL